MAKTNYSFEKRQKEIAKKQKQEEKRKRKHAQQDAQPLEQGDADATHSPVDRDEAT